MESAARNPPTRIIVLGTERSGTSLVTEMVHRWGAYAGEPDKLTAANEHNPQGQWEYEPLWDFLVEVGDFAKGVTWWDASFEERIKAKLQRPALRGKALELIAAMEREGRPWVWKDPAVCHFLPFWKPIWGDVTYVITVRHPYDVAQSWQHMAVPASLRGSVDLVACNLLRWQHMMLMVLRATEDVDSKLFVEYEGLLRQPLGEARRLAAFLDEQSRSASADEQIIRAMAQAVNPALWHNRVDRPLSEFAEATAEQRALYDFLRRKVTDPAAEFGDDFPMPPGWWDFVHHAEAIVRANQ